MPLTQTQILLMLFQKCIHSEIDLITFCEEFCFYALSLEEGPFKDTCSALMQRAIDYLLNKSSVPLTPESILEASDLFDQIQKTYHQLNEL